MGLAEEVQHAGAEPVDEATRDRCVFIRTTYPGWDVEQQFLAKSITFMRNCIMPWRANR
jgi:MoxR-like ATPase